MNYLKALWAYRGFILGSVKREFQSKYRNSLLGAAWTVINPLAMIVVYTVIFAQIMRAKLPGVDGIFAYSIYLCAGILTWGLFAEITGRSQNIFLENANLLKKLSFPRLCLPVVVVANAALNFAIIFGLFTLFLLVSGNFPGAAYLAVVPLLAIVSAFAIGLGMTLGVLNVFFRDVGQFFGIFVQFWFWLTPIVYPSSILPAGVQNFMAYNPMAPLMAGFQGVLVLGQWPQWSSLIYPAVLAALLCLLGMRLFRRHAGDMVDEL
ncbi:ABC transporter permease [Rhodoferax sp.]|uniref:ABC transporter permease n=1 Tax=Rhodoferax sp. TaxID=50421 RepID=UPI00260FD94B|nr:ABC transporter permease [Rhodoferax sp.]MDD3935647.1 ABC transporter permease [Rhodoferax sp.]